MGSCEYSFLKRKEYFRVRSKIGKKSKHESMSSGVFVRLAVMKICSDCLTSNTHNQKATYICFYLFIYLLILISYIFNCVNTVNSKIYDLWLWSLADFTSFLKTCPYLLTIFSYYTSLLDPYGPYHPECTELLLSVSLHENQKYLRLTFS